MTASLPAEFTERMKKDLGDEFDSFLRSYSDENKRGLRFNALKNGAREASSGTELGEKIPWEDMGFYYPEDARPGKSSLHSAGAYYIQEPSAMAPVSFLDVKPGMCVLDLCAAPGGKSTQIASKLMGEGLLVANEPVRDRASILSGNIERMGIKNALVISHDPSEIKDRFAASFDRILVDAPCSGEGMFRKDDIAIAEWSPENVERCAARQREILDAATGMLKPGGRLVYSTCTFARAEDEDMISDFLSRHPDYHPVEVSPTDGMHSSDQSGCLRIYPQDGYGEGHFLGVLERDGVSGSFGYHGAGELPISNKEKQEIAIYRDFVRFNITGEMAGELLDESRLFMMGDRLCLMPDTGLPALNGLHVMRAGLELGRMKKGRFEPSHSLALALSKSDAFHVLDLDTSSKEVSDYIEGLALPSPFDNKALRGEKKDPASSVKGWILVCTSGISLGWARASGDLLKNHYPRGLRISDQ